jgi:hypothetical protein
MHPPAEAGHETTDACRIVVEVFPVQPTKVRLLEQTYLEFE